MLLGGRMVQHGPALAPGSLMRPRRFVASSVSVWGTALGQRTAHTLVVVALVLSCSDGDGGDKGPIGGEWSPGPSPGGFFGGFGF